MDNPGSSTSLDVQATSSLSTPEKIVQPAGETSQADNPDESVLPCNGIKDQHSADVLNSELDELENNAFSNGNEPSSPIVKPKLHLDVARPHLKSHSPSGSSRSPEALQEDEWVLLDLCYGLPLFNTILNKEVCSRIAKLKLFKQESLQELVQSSRLLSLKLLDFIMAWQVPHIVTEIDTNGVPQIRDEHCSLFPSQNILFDGSRIHVWKGH
ncbi:unnamed protein product [Lymnaea stagnalis]|uniref:FAM91 C-terminal domain-containing protein n=1 Tax=Lymnaea stagnalis TaxID=6523 RepID=A0AAV2HK71_LYMST